MRNVKHKSGRSNKKSAAAMVRELIAVNQRINSRQFAGMLGCTIRTASKLMISLAADGADVIDTAAPPAHGGNGGNGEKRGRRIRAIALADALKYIERHKIMAEIHKLKSLDGTLVAGRGPAGTGDAARPGALLG